jgi:hypothetical protein
MSESDTSNRQSLPETTALTEVTETQAKTSPQPMEEAERLEPTQKLLQRNRLLLNHVVQLEQALRQSQEELQVQQARSQAQETLLAQHREMLKVSEDQIERLFSELESSHQANHRQQVLIETLSNQFETSQERVAHLERECALIQQQYNEQSHRMLQAENTCQDLQNRLQRQQRQTLQFKAALEKCLETPEGKYRDRMEPPQEFQPQPVSFSAPAIIESPEVLSSCVPAAAELAVETPNVGGSDRLCHSEIDLLPQPAGADASTEPVSGDDTEHMAEPPAICLDDRALAPWPLVEEKLITSPASEKQNPVLSLPEELEQELSPQLLADLTSVLQLLDETNENLAAVSAIETLDRDRPAVELESQLDLSQLSPEVLESTATDRIGDLTDTSDRQLLEAESSADNAEDETELKEEAYLPSSNWPSPLVRPLRPTKKLKSWAAIELPTFPRLRRYSK